MGVYVILQKNNVIAASIIHAAADERIREVLTQMFGKTKRGDFKWVGFFKRKKGTVFAKWDTVLYSPLCFLLGTAILMIMLLRTA